MTSADLIFTVCQRNDLTLGELAERAGVEPERLCLAIEARGMLEDAERGRIASLGRKLKKQRETP